MPWRANVIYSAPVDSVIAAFKQRGLGDALYVVRDLDGIRFQWAREEFEKKTSTIRHGLPPRGLLAVMPPAGGSNYDHPGLDQRAAHAQRDDDYGDAPATKWEKAGFAGRGRIAETRTELEWPTGLHDTLVAIAAETGEPLFHYFCETSGGPPDFEAAFVASPGWPISVLAKRDDDDPRDPLVDALVFLGLELPSGFFAPHERSFDWSRYVVT